MHVHQTIKRALTLLAANAVFSSCIGGEFINGSFELPAITTTNSALMFTPTPFAPVCPSENSARLIITNDAFIMTGWYKTGPGTVGQFNGRSGALQYDPVDGTHQLNFNGGNTLQGAIISQTFDTVVGETYDVTFNVGRISTGSGEISLTARVISQTNDSLGTLKVIPPATEGYGPISRLIFTATTPTTTLAFEDTSLVTCSVDIALDNVSVTPATQQPMLDLAFYAGLRIRGRVGQLYRIEYATAVDTNAWATLTTISLPSNPYLFIDPTLPTLPVRFYRVMELP